MLGITYPEGFAAEDEALDPYFSSVSSLVHFDNSLVDIKGRTWTAVGSAAATGTAKFGSNGLSLNGTSDYLYADGSTTFTFGTGDFTIECWARTTSLTLSVIWDFRPVAGGTGLMLALQGSGAVSAWTNNNYRLTSTSTMSTNTYYHIAVTRASGTLRLFFNGTQEGGTYADSVTHTVGANRPVIGTDGSSPGLFYWGGLIDDFRVTKGVARYTSNFIIPSTAFPDM